MHRRHVKSSADVARQWANVLYYSTRVVGAVVAYYGLAFLFQRPYYSVINVLTLAMLYHYLVAPDSMWHQSQQLENQFWMLVALLSSGSNLFAPDSPYLLSRYLDLDPAVGTAVSSSLVLATVIVAHFVDKRQHRSRLKANVVLMGGYQHNPSLGNATAESKTEKLEQLVRQLDSRLPSTLHTLWNVNKWVHIEREILEIFAGCSKEELNYVLFKSEMKLLAYKLKNHKYKSNAGIDLTGGLYARHNRSRSGLMEILCVRRVSDLNLAARAVVLDVIQGLRMTVHPDTEKEAQEWVANLLLTVKGDELSDLKQLVDNKGSAESMHKLVYEDILQDSLRVKVLDHFRKQASIQEAQLAMRSSLAKKRMSKGPWRKILSDVDDTLFSSGGRYPAGIDTSYKRKVFYPGVTQFYKELDLGTVGPEAESGEWPSSRFGDLVFLSARPHVYKDLTETSMYVKFRKFMKTQGLHCMPSLLPGDLESGQAFMLRGDFEPMAVKKMRNFAEYYSIYPEFKHVFIGDNGQADVRAAEMMVERFGRSVVEKVFIHEVQPRQFTYGYEPGVSEDKWERYGIVFCRSYIAAAVSAAVSVGGHDKKPMILRKGLRRVVAAAREEFVKVMPTWKDTYERDLRRLELNADIQEANAHLERWGLQPIPVMQGVQHFAVGALVYTGFGRGYVRKYRPFDGIYEVVLDWGTSQSPPKVYTALHGLYKSEKALRSMHESMQTSQLSDALLQQQQHQLQQRKPPIAPGSASSRVEVVPATRLAEHSSSLSSRSSVASGESTMSSFSRMSSVSSKSGISLQYALEGMPKGEDSGAMLAAAAISSSNHHLHPSHIHQNNQLYGFYTCVRSFAGAKAPKLQQSLRRRLTEDSAEGYAVTPSKDTASSVQLNPSARPSQPESLPPLLLLSSVTPHDASMAPRLGPGRDSSLGGMSGSSRESGLGSVAILPASSRREKIAQPVAEEVLDLGAQVSTPFGEGLVLGFRDRDLIYEIVVCDNVLLFAHEHNVVLWNGAVFREKASDLVRKGSYPRRLFGLIRKVFVREEEDNVLVQRPVIKADTIVRTPFGQGTVDSFRSHDCMYEVRLVWGAKAFLRQVQVAVDETYVPPSTAAVSEAVSRSASPLQKAKEFGTQVLKKIKLPFSAGGSKAEEPAITTIYALQPRSKLPLAEERARIQAVWRLRPGDQVLAAGLGRAVVMQVRQDGFVVVRLSFGATAYLHVARLLTPASKVPVGARVLTEYGYGVVKFYRDLDFVYCVKLDNWGAQVYIPMRPQASSGFTSSFLNFMSPSKPPRKSEP